MIERKFKYGDVVVWSGHNPCISRIDYVNPLWWSDTLQKYYDCSNTYKLTHYGNKERYNSCSESNLRMADEIEIRLLGKKKIVFIPMSKRQKKERRAFLKFIRTPIK